MEVILLERVENLGFIGDHVNVKTGYARNYLLAQKKALRVTKDNLAFFEKEKAKIEAENLKKKEDAEKAAEKINTLEVTLIRQASASRHLYGSVTPRDLEQALEKEGITVKKNQILLGQPIKELGIHQATINLHPEVKATILVNIALTAEEALSQINKFKGAKVVNQDDKDVAASDAENPTSV